MKDFKTLIEKWSAIEPQRCRFLGTVGMWVGDIKKVEDGNHSLFEFIKFGTFENGFNEYSVQGILQKAIIAHGWYYNLTIAREAKDKPLTYVCQVYTCSWDGLHSGQTTQGPAHAMMEAYVKALEAVKKLEAEEVVV